MYITYKSAWEMIILVYTTSNDFPERLKTQFFTKFIDNPFIGVNITDGEGRVIFVNKTHYRITGQNPHEYLGRKMEELYDEKAVSSSAVMEVLKKKQEVVVHQATSAGKFFEVYGVPVFDEEKNIEYIINYLMDISDIEYFKAYQKELETQYKNLKKTVESMDSLIYRSKAMEKIVEQTKKISISDVEVLITGPSGVGKELIAELVQKNSKRYDKPFIKINCAAIPENLLESELFGYEPGAFTGGSKKGKKGLFEEANEGTILLDEIGELPLSLQSKLLRVIQYHEIRRIGGTKLKKVDFRLIASTNASLKELIEQKKFRSDLYYRINIIEINVPSLEERREDIPILAEHFLNIFNAKHSLKRSLSDEAIDYLSKINYPGNVRGLRNIMESLVIQSHGDTIGINDIIQCTGESEKVNLPKNEILDDINLKEKTAEFEKDIITKYFKKYGSVKETAQALGCEQSTVSKKIKKYKIKK